MPKHNFAMLTSVRKTVRIITTTSYIQVDYTVIFFSGQIGLSFGGINGNGYLLIFVFFFIIKGKLAQNSIFLYFFFFFF
ncbi:unnamed protein product, partial [Staurois parvus]